MKLLWMLLCRTTPTYPESTGTATLSLPQTKVRHGDPSGFLSPFSNFLSASLFRLGSRSGLMLSSLPACATPLLQCGIQVAAAA